ncbi:pregnancy-specific glycoprotein 22-like isoform X2 [Onychomys torridus]|uniref:pregnancy-specific glycoprotein 22-like isoform X2 n=1 Tax=Onychomys torridus TaxID=38674 RepID=UPI00167F5506|nr:pregnancy-specific glycoprotein 22-like isoform X2 [Onychomys torridus]
MEVYSVIPCKGCSPWQGLLLTVSLLTCCHMPTTAQVTIESVPPHVVEGDNVLLHVHNLPENLLAFVWHKGARNMSLRIALYLLAKDVSVKGPVHSGRETVYSNGSLQINNVTQKDTGFYTLRTINRRIGIVSIASMYLHVHTSLLNCGHHLTSAQPTIESVPPSVAEGSSVLLLVHNLPQNLLGFFWYKGMVVFNNLEISRHLIFTNSSMLGPAHSGRETMYNNGSLLLQNVTSKDAGLYTLRTVTTDLKAEVLHMQVQMDTSPSTCCNPLMIEPVPQNAAEGESVLFLVHNLPEDVRSFSWYKGVSSFQMFKMVEYNRAMNSITPGLAHSRRAMVCTNGSLLLQDVTEEDAGFYTLQTLNRKLKTETTHVQLHVNKPVSQPFMGVSDTTVPVQGSVLFTCLSTDTGISIHWIFNNQSLQLTKRMSLSPTKCRLSIDPVRMEDAGEYKCEVSNPVSSKTSLPVRLAIMFE